MFNYHRTVYILVVVKPKSNKDVTKYLSWFLIRAGKVGGIHWLDAHDSNSEPFMAWH